MCNCSTHYFLDYTYMFIKTNFQLCEIPGVR